MLSWTKTPRESESFSEIVLIATRKDRTAKIRRGLHGLDHEVEIDFAEISGKGPPPRQLGSPGDIYIDTSSEPCDIYGRMASTWSKVSSSYNVIHPLWPGLHLYYNTGVAPTWSDSTLHPPIELEGRILSTTKLSTKSAKSPMAPKRKFVHVETSMTERPFKKANNSSREDLVKLPTCILSFPLQQLLKSFKVRRIPANLVNMTTPNSSGVYIIHFSQFWGSSLPSAEIGSPGDLFLVISAAVHKVFVKKDTWIQWEGASSLSRSPITHPNFPDLTVSFTETDLTWATYEKPPVEYLNPWKTMGEQIPFTITADECVRKMMQSTALKPSEMAGPYKIGGSLLYWRAEYERAELRCEQLSQENTRLKNQVADMQHTVSLEDLTGPGLESDAETLIKMKDTLLQNPKLRNLVLLALAEALNPFLPTPNSPHEFRTDMQHENPLHGNKPPVLTGVNNLPSKPTMQPVTHDDEKASQGSYAGVPPGELAPSALVIPAVNHQVKAIQLGKLDVSSTLRTTESESSVSLASTSIHNDAVEDPPDAATPSTSDEEILNEMTNSLIVEPPSSPRSPEIDSPEMEGPLPNPASDNKTPDTESPVIGSEEPVSKDSDVYLELFGPDDDLNSGAIDVDPRAEVASPPPPNSPSASPSRDMEGSPSSKKDSKPSGEVYIKQESPDNSVPLQLSASYLGVIYHVLDVSKAHVCRLCLQLNPPQIAQFSPAVSEKQLEQHGKEKHAATYQLLVNMDPEQLSAILAKISTASHAATAPQSSRISTSASV